MPFKIHHHHHHHHQSTSPISFLLLFSYLDIQWMEFFSVDVCIWIMFWGSDPNMSSVNYPNNARESPFVLEAGSYSLLSICCKIIFKNFVVKAANLYFFTSQAIQLTVWPLDVLAWQINSRLRYSLKNAVHTTQCNVEPVCDCSCGFLVRHAPWER